jgi:hypothetical protein
MHSSINKLLLLAGLLASIAFAGASLTMTAATIAADGVTITILFSGATGGMSPSTGVTGFSVSDGHGNAYTVSSAGASAHTVILVLALPVNGATDDTVTVTLATSPTSNLTDTASSTPAGQSNFATTNGSAWYAPGGSLAGYSRIQGGISATSGNGYLQTAQWNSSDGFLEFNACASQLNVTTFLDNSHYVLLQDGVQVNDWGQNGSGTTWAALGAVTGLTGCHDYQIIQIESVNVPFPDQLIKSVQIIGTLGVQPALRSLVAESGDSLVDLAGTTPPSDSRVAHMYQSSSAFAAVDQHMGWAGYNVYGAGQIAALAPSAYSNLGAAPALAYLRGGANDIVSGVTTANFSAAWTTYITGVQGVAQVPAHIICLGIPSDSRFSSGTQATYNALIQAAAAANGVTYIDTTAWYGPTGNRQSDNLHLSYGLPTTDLTKGENIMTNRLAPITAGYLDGSSYSIAGPTVGVVGTASTAFTVTLAGGNAVFMADVLDSVARECIVLTESSGGTFTPSVGGSGAGPLSVCATAGNSWTFTYTPVSAGAKTIGFTSTAALGWKDPASANYLSLAPGGAVLASGTVVASQVIR